VRLADREGAAVDAAKFVGNIPENYDHGLVPHIFEGYADDLVARLTAGAPTEILELAAGTGVVSRKIRDRVSAESSLTVTDLNGPMLDVARAKFRHEENVLFKTADAGALDFPDDAFDAVVCQFGVMFFPDKAEAYGETRRVLRAGGRYLFNVWCGWAGNAFARIAHETAADFFPDDPPGFYRVPFGYCDPDEIRRALVSEGFQEVEIDSVSLAAPILSADRFARGLVFGNPLHQEVIDRGGDAEALCTRLAEALTSELGETLDLQALVIQAR
jgi:SAM-dependent methyltransferase